MTPSLLDIDMQKVTEEISLRVTKDIYHDYHTVMVKDMRFLPWTVNTPVIACTFDLLEETGKPVWSEKMGGFSQDHRIDIRYDEVLRDGIQTNT